MMSLSSPWTLSMFFMKSPTSSPFSVLSISSATILPKAGSDAHSSSSMSLTRSLWAELNVITPTVSPFLRPFRISFSILTTSSASVLLHLSSHIPSVTRTSIGGMSGTVASGAMRSFPP